MKIAQKRLVYSAGWFCSDNRRCVPYVCLGRLRDTYDIGLADCIWIVIHDRPHPDRTKLCRVTEGNYCFWDWGDGEGLNGAAENYLKRICGGRETLWAEVWLEE